MKRTLTFAGWLVLGVVAGLAMYAVLTLHLGAAGFYSLAMGTAMVLGFFCTVVGSVVMLRRHRSPNRFAFWAGMLLLLGVCSVQVLILSPGTVWPLNLWA